MIIHKPNKVLSLLFGQAIGDALGLATEFMTKDEVAITYPNGIHSYSDIIQDRHRSRWQQGEWTDDTDQLLCVANSIIDKKIVDTTNIASKLVDWKKQGGMGIGSHTNRVLSIGDYIEKPYRVSKFVWEMSRKRTASNGAIMRTSILGAWNYTNWDVVKSNTENVCRLTHYDPRCVGSCVIITYLVHCLFNGNQNISKAESVEIALEYDASIVEYFEGISKVILEGGDADTNAAVVGGLLGLKFGYNNIPPLLIDGLIHKDYLFKVAEDFEKLS